MSHLLLAVVLFAIALIAILAIRRARERSREHSAVQAQRAADFARAQAEWKLKNCNVIVDRSPDGAVDLKRDERGKYVLVDQDGREWYLYWGIGNPATGSFWDAFESRMMGFLSVPDWVGFHCRAEKIELAYVLTPSEVEHVRRTDYWSSGIRPHSAQDLSRMLGSAKVPDRRSGYDRRQDTGESLAGGAGA